MTELVLTPPCRFINANDRLHHIVKARLTKAWRASAWSAATFDGVYPRNLKVERAHIFVSIRFATNHRRDVGNFYPTAKAIIDGIVDAGVLVDDDDSHVIGPDMRREYPNGEPRVTVRIEALP